MTSLSSGNEAGRVFACIFRRQTHCDRRGYAELLEHADVTRFGEHDLRVIELPTLIEIKSTTGRAKDRLVVPILLKLARQRGISPTE